MDIQERTSVSCSGAISQHVELYGFNTVWESLIWFQQEISQTRAMQKWGDYHNARGHPKRGKYILKLGTTKMGFNFNQADMWFNP